MLQKIADRFLDISLSIIILLFFAPIFLIISIIIKIQDGGPIFADNCLRLGKGMKLFNMYKFRSMVVDAHIKIQQDEHLTTLKTDWEKYHKLPSNKDPRVTKFGKFLRLTDIDEIPQFLNVIKGDMSIVGPRPWFDSQFKKNISENPELMKDSEIIFSVKPGITGLWQVSGRNKNSIKKRLEMEIEYARNKNTLNDIGIILKTPFVIIEHIIQGDDYEK